VQWKVNGVNRAAGAQPAIAVGRGTVTGRGSVPDDSHNLVGDDDWTFERA
jgi:hypothetical protein